MVTNVNVKFFLLYSLMPLINAMAQSPCQSIQVCNDFKLVNSNDDDRMSIINRTVPREYEVNLKFPPNGHLEGSVKIEADIVERTNRIAINANERLEIDYRRMTIDVLGCPQESTESSGCIEKVVYFRDWQTAIIELKDAYLELGSIIDLTFPRFYNSEIKGSIPEYFIPRFAFRGVQSVFPSIDDPAFKAKFRLCVESSPELMVVSTMPVIDDRSVIGAETTDDGLTRNCFETTPPLTTGSLGLALLDARKFLTMRRKVPSGRFKVLTAIEAYYMKGFEKEADAAVDTFLTAMNVANQVTDFDYPLSIVSIVVLENYIPIDGLSDDTLGLFVIGLANIPDHETWPLYVFSKVLSQWIGTVVSIRNMQYTCMQEGLVEFMSWWFMTKLYPKDVYMESIAYGLKNKYSVPDDYESLTKAYDVPHGRYLSSYFFHTLDRFYGHHRGKFGAVIEFMRSLLRKYAYKSVGIEEWDQTLEEIIGERGGQKSAVKGYFQAWFSLPGMLHLFIKRISPDCISIGHGLPARHASSILFPRPVPMRIYSFEGATNTSRPVMFDKVYQTVCNVTGRGGYLVDPDRHTWTRKVYPIENYLSFYEIYDQKEISGPAVYPFLSVMEDFCWALKKDLFPLTETDPGTVADWVKLHHIVSIAAHLNGEIENSYERKSARHGTCIDQSCDFAWCYCCSSLLATGKDDLRLLEQCSEEMLGSCRQLRIARMVMKNSRRKGSGTVDL